MWKVSYHSRCQLKYYEIEVQVKRSKAAGEMPHRRSLEGCTALLACFSEANACYSFSKAAYSASNHIICTVMYFIKRKPRQTSSS